MSQISKSNIQVCLRLPAHLNDWLENRSKQNMRFRHNEMLFIFESLRKAEETKKR